MILQYNNNNNNNKNNNNGLLKYTWWHKNYELQCAYIVSEGLGLQAIYKLFR